MKNHKNHELSAGDIVNLELFLQSLILSIVSIRSMKAYQEQAYKAGLLEGDLTELSKTICWELHRLMGLYKQQTADVMDQMGYDENDLAIAFKNALGEPKNAD